MKNSIIGICISEEIKRLLVHGKRKADLSDYPEIEKYIKANKTAHHLVDDLSNPHYPVIDEQFKKTQVNRLFHLVSKKQSQVRLRKQLVISISATAAIMILSFLIFSPDKQESIKLIETHATNHAPTLIMEDGVSIDLSNVSPDSLKKIALQSITADNRLMYNRISIPNHYTYDITLEDGTEVFLNACSELKYPKIFIGDERVVELKGEAFFRVTKSSKPFIIKTDSTTVKVYGTSFNISTSPKITETILVEGSIGITKNNSGEEVRLLPNQRHILRDGFMKIESIDAINAIGWLNNEFNFSQIPISELLEKIADWYGVSFEVILSDSEDISIDVSSPRTMKIEQLIEVIESTTDLQFIKEIKDKYIVKRK